MNNEDSEYAADIFQEMCLGMRLNTSQSNRLQAILDRMEAPERAGTIAAIIKIMLEGGANESKTE